MKLNNKYINIKTTTITTLKFKIRIKSHYDHIKRAHSHREDAYADFFRVQIVETPNEAGGKRKTVRSRGIEREKRNATA